MSRRRLQLDITLNNGKSIRLRKLKTTTNARLIPRKNNLNDIISI